MNSTKWTAPEYVLHIKPLPADDGDDDGVRRLRRLLKSLARYWGFQVKGIRPPLPEEQEAG